MNESEKKCVFLSLTSQTTNTDEREPFVIIVISIIYKYIKTRQVAMEEVETKRLVCVSKDRLILNFYEHSNKSPKLFHVSTVTNAFFALFAYLSAPKIFMPNGKREREREREDPNEWKWNE